MESGSISKSIDFHIINCFSFYLFLAPISTKSIQMDRVIGEIRRFFWIGLINECVQIENHLYTFLVYSSTYWSSKISAEWIDLKYNNMFAQCVNDDREIWARIQPWFPLPHHHSTNSLIYLFVEIKCNKMLITNKCDILLHFFFLGLKSNKHPVPLKKHFEWRYLQ